MILAAHQPHLLPWLGYLDRMRQADLFIILDHVQFESANYQNRTRIKTAQGARWLTVPVRTRSQAELIAEKTIEAWRRRCLPWNPGRCWRWSRPRTWPAPRR